MDALQSSGCISCFTQLVMPIMGSQSQVHNGATYAAKNENEPMSSAFVFYI